MRSIFIILSMISYSIAYAQQGSWISLDNAGVGTLNAAQLAKYEIITNQRLYGSGFLVTVTDLIALQQHGLLEFELPDRDCYIKAKSNRVRYINEDNYSWSASIVPNENPGCECEDGFLTIVKKNGRYIGHLSVDEDDYVLEDLGGGKQLLVKLTFRETELLYCDMDEESFNYLPNNLDLDFRDWENCPVTLLVLYTADAAMAVADIEATIELAVEKTNTAFLRSRVGFELQLVGIEETSFQETSNGIKIDVAALASDPSIMDIRNDYNADIVILFADGDYGSSIGRVAAIGPDPDNAFGIVQAAESTGTFIFPHEVGHLFGCRHQIEVDPSGTYEHAHKLKLGLKRRRTISWSPLNDKLIQNFSNPQVGYSGKPTGAWGESHNALKLNVTNCIVAAFFPNSGVGLSGYISGPLAVCLDMDFQVQAVVEGGMLGTYQYEWSYTFDGFNYIPLGINIPFAVIPAINLPSMPHETYHVGIRAIVTDQIGNGITLFKVVEATNEDYGQEPPCSPPIQDFMPNEASLSVFLIHPNPGKDRVSLHSVNTEIVESIEIYDLRGKRFQRTLIDSLPADLDISTFVPGMYFVRLKTEHGILTSKFIKL